MKLKFFCSLFACLLQMSDAGICCVNASSATQDGKISIDMTYCLVNPDFGDASFTDNAPHGWALECTSSPQSKISTASKADGFIPAGQNHWQLWQGSGKSSGKAYQTATGLPDGKYLVTAKIVRSFGGSLSLFADACSTSIPDGGAATYSVEADVSNGRLDLGIGFDATNGLLIDYDDFTLTLIDAGIQSYRSILSGRIEEATLETMAWAGISTHPGYDVADGLRTAIENAKALLTSGDKADIRSALSDLDDAIGTFRSTFKTYTQLYDAIQTAKKYIASTSFGGKDAFQKVIDESQEMYESAQNQCDAIPQQIALLKKAYTLYYNTQYTISPISQTISTVDLSLDGSEKFVLRVDGKPFYMTNIQVRLDKLYGYQGWDDSALESVLEKAADDGFNTVSIPVHWVEIEPKKDFFDWQILDKFMTWCMKYNIRMELLWFSWSSGGRVQYLWNWNGRTQLRTPDYVCSLDGHSDYNMLHSSMEYSLDWRDTRLRDREAYVVGQMMEHIAVWEANNGQPHTVIGIQLGNEARGHYENSASSSEIIEYYNVVGDAVKASKHRVWTRLNCVCNETAGRTAANEKRRRNGGTSIDFVGVDIYGTSASAVKGNLSGYLDATGQNYRMIMECGAKDSNSPIYQMAALAGDKAFDYYNYCVVDGNALYSNDGTTLVERSHVGEVRQRNKILNLANQDIALRSHGKGLYVYNYAGNSVSPETGLAGISFTPYENRTQAIAVRHTDDSILLLPTSSGQFSIPASLGIVRVAEGYMDGENQWVETGTATMHGNTITVLRPCCLRLESQATTIGSPQTSMPSRAYDGFSSASDACYVHTLSGLRLPSSSTLCRSIIIQNGKKIFVNK